MIMTKGKKDNNNAIQNKNNGEIENDNNKR